MNVPPEKTSKAARPQFQSRRYGVYDIIYEAHRPLVQRLHALSDGWSEMHAKTPYAQRLVADAMQLAPAAFVTFIMATIWAGISSAIYLYWLGCFFDTLGSGLTNVALSRAAFRSLAIPWLCFCVMDNLARLMHIRSDNTMAERFRAYFIPQLIRASLRVDLLSIHDLHSTFPVQGRFESEFPGLRFLSALNLLVRRTLDLTSQVYVVLHSISCKPSPEREILLGFFVARGLLLWLTPVNAIGTPDYVYWIDNPHFQQMKVLFGLAFCTQYRADILLDGVASRIETEYRKFAKRLGNVATLEPSPWGSVLQRDWVWGVLSDVTSEYALALYVLVFSASLSPSSISSMILLLQATRSITLTVRQYDGEWPTFLQACTQAERLYNAIEHRGTILPGTESFPRTRSNDAGMKISFRHVSLLYPGGNHHALHDVSFEILPGELVLVAGTNGSGKSSTLKLLARLFDPTAGEILIDDVPLVSYDPADLRAAMALQPQTPAIYPVSVSDNITFSLPPTCSVERRYVEAAARTGGCTEWIARLEEGYDTQLQPSFDINNKWLQGMHGCPSNALREVLTKHDGLSACISGGEQQRLATARTFMRIDNCATRLVVVDEATSALDPVAERAILTELCQRRVGKTIIVITHRFHHLAHAADRILCMKDGSVIENGTHAELVRLDGHYAGLYHAQMA